jgi:hypothetical protein
MRTSVVDGDSDAHFLGPSLEIFHVFHHLASLGLFLHDALEMSEGLEGGGLNIRADSHRHVCHPLLTYY